MQEQDLILRRYQNYTNEASDVVKLEEEIEVLDGPRVVVSSADIVETLIVLPEYKEKNMQ